MPKNQDNLSQETKNKVLIYTILYYSLFWKNYIWFGLFLAPVICNILTPLISNDIDIILKYKIQTFHSWFIFLKTQYGCVEMEVLTYPILQENAINDSRWHLLGRILTCATPWTRMMFAQCKDSFWKNLCAKYETCS